MKLIETIKIVDGHCCNMQYHSERAGFILPEPNLGEAYLRGVVKWRMEYGDESITNSFVHYTLPAIGSLKTVDGTRVNYNKKFADRSEIDLLMRLKGDCDDILIIRDGKVSDTSFCNVVFENRHGLYTPSTPMLAGTKREMLLRKGIIFEADITVSDLQKYSYVHLINAMIELDDKITIPIEKIEL